MFKFSKLVSSSPINLRMLATAHLTIFTKRQHNNSNSFKKSKKQNRYKQKNAMAAKGDGVKEYCSFRKWEKFGDMRPLNGGQKFMVMSYNILAQNLLEAHSYIYKNHEPRYLEWNERIEKLSCEILTLRPEILCLQEMQQEHLQMMLSHLSEMQFDHIFNKNTGPRTDGCAILYNRNKFVLVEDHCVEFYQPNIEYLDRHNIALAAKLRLRDNPAATVLVVTTHLLYNPRRQDVRLAQIQVLLAEIDMLSFNGYSNDKFEPQRLPIILTGDFNLEPMTAPYRLISDSYLRYNNLTRHTLEIPDYMNRTIVGNYLLPHSLGITDNCQHIDIVRSEYKGTSRLYKTDIKEKSKNHSPAVECETRLSGENVKRPSCEFSSGQLTHNLNLTSVYQHCSKDGQHREASTYQDQWVNVDYIFYSNNRRKKCVGETDLKLMSWYTLPVVEQCNAIETIPNSKFGSDHLSLAAEFLISS